MAKQDPVARLRRFVNRLKKQRPKDCRKPPSSPPGEGPRTEYGRFQVSLLHPWQVWEYLLMYEKEPCRGRDDFHHFAPPYWVDEETVMITTPSAMWDGWCVRLIWPAGEDYCVRVLKDEEIAIVSNLNHLAIRQAFRFTLRRPK